MYRNSPTPKANPEPKARNARFWVFWRHAFVKLTLRPGQTLSCHSFSRDEEGYGYEHETYTHEDGQIVCDYCSGGRDCDGQISSGGRVTWHIGGPTKLAYNDPEGGHLHHGLHIRQPEWQKAGSEWRRDAYAAAAGY